MARENRYIVGNFTYFCKVFDITNKCKVNILSINDYYVKFYLNELKELQYHLVLLEKI